MKPDILFINPSGRAQIYQDLSQDIAAIEPPIWCRLLSSYCERKGIETEILDADAEGFDVETAVQEAIDAEPELVVMVAHGQQPSASTQVMPGATYFCQRFKAEREDIPVLIIGGHPAALPERTLEETGADYVCTGEGPATVAALLEYLKTSGRNWQHGYRHDIPGIVYRMEKGTVLKTDPAPNIWNLDGEMPGGYWDLLPSFSRYRAHVWHALTNGGERKPYASIYTSLGCSFQCSFCNVQNPFREGDKLKFDGKANSYRTWSATSVIREIETLVERHNVRNLKIADEMFILKPSHVDAVCDAIIERGYGEKLNIWCYGRVDCTHERYLDKLRRAGVKWIALGIEAASTDVRDGVEKADYDERDIYRTCERIRAAGINIMGNFMVGLPSDTHESIKQTLSLALAIRPEFMNVYAMMIYPGTTLWRALPEEKRNYNWASYSHHAYECTPAGNAGLSPAAALCWRDEFLHRYFTDPGYLAMIERKFGPEAMEEVMKTTSVKLKRKLLGD